MRLRGADLGPALQALQEAASGVGSLTWSDGLEAAFDAAKAALAAFPVVYLPDLAHGHGDFRITADASHTGLGAVVEQVQVVGDAEHWVPLPEFFKQLGYLTLGGG